MDTTALTKTTETLSVALTAAGADVRPLEIGPPASASELDALEAELGIALPPSLRSTFETIASSVEWTWQLTDRDLPQPFDGIFCGGLEWSTETLVDTHRSYRGWVEEVFPDPEDPYDIVWHDKLGLVSVPNGDVIAADLAPQEPHVGVVHEVVGIFPRRGQQCSHPDRLVDRGAIEAIERVARSRGAIGSHVSFHRQRAVGRRRSVPRESGSPCPSSTRHRP